MTPASVSDWLGIVHVDTTEAGARLTEPDPLSV